MKTSYKRPLSSRIPGYRENAVLQLLVVVCLAYMMYTTTQVVLVLAKAAPDLFSRYFVQNLGLPPEGMFVHKWWSMFTYGWISDGFWQLFSNMIWLYAFGSIVQMLVGYKQVIPMFMYSLFVGGLFYGLGQLLPGDFFQTRGFYTFGPQAALVGLAVAALTISPGHRWYFTDHFSVPLVVVAIVFFVLQIMNTNLQTPGLIILLGGAVTGFGYIKLLQRGYKPGTWMYDIFDSLERKFTPDERAYLNKDNRHRTQVLNSLPPKPQNNIEKKIDDILDKINQHGYASLTEEEKNILTKAGKEDKL